MKVEIIVACLVMGFALRYVVALSQGCLFIGKAISTDDSKTGFQDAVTPPQATNLSLVVYGLCLAVVIFAFGSGGFWLGTEAIGTLAIWSFLSGYILPKPHSPYWQRMIYRSMVWRTANYVKSGDTLRADAADMLTKRIGAQFKGALI